MLQSYFEFCQFISAYVLYTIGLAALVVVIGYLALLASYVWEEAMARWVKRFKAAVSNYGAWEDFREFRRQRKEEREKGKVG
mgnify:FL=1|jgi:hypothetical protein